MVYRSDWHGHNRLGLTLAAYDMAKIGWMLLNGGVYNNKRVLLESWITEMTAPRIHLGERFGNMDYGYLWYRPEKDKPVFAAIGDCGNVIYANEEKKIAVGVTGTFKPRNFDRIDFIDKHIVSLVESIC